MQNLKQGTLSFASAKRSNSAPHGKPQKRAPVAEKATNKRVVIREEAHSDARSSEVHEIPSDENVDVSAAEEITVPIKRTRTSAKAHTTSETTKKVLSQPLPSEVRKPSPEERERLDVNDKAGRYRKYYNEVRSKTRHMEPIHSEGQNKIHQILRFFDMSYEFGPCIGMTRLERWERAETFGLNPPVEVRDILLTKEGAEKAEYSQCVLHDEV